MRSKEGKAGCVKQPAFVLRYFVNYDQLDCETLCHLVVRIHEPFCFTAEVSSTCYLRDDRIELTDLRSEFSNCSDESCVDE